MDNYLVSILTLAIMAGQLSKLFLNKQGITILDVVVLILCLIGILQTRFKLIKPPQFIIFSLIFSLVSLISLIFSPLSLTLANYFSSFLYIVRFFSYFLLGWLLLSNSLIPLKKNANNILLFSGVGIAILGILQFIFLPDLRFLASFGWDPHLYRTASTFLDPNFSGAFFVLTLLLIFHLGGDPGRTPRVFYTIFAIVYLALLTTFSRSSYLIFLISFLTLAVFKKSIKITALTLVLFTLLIFSFQIYIRGVNQITPLDRGQTASFRLSTWQQGFEIFRKSPFLGIGFNAYQFALKQYRLGNEQFLAGKGATTNDSSLLHVLATTGVIGFIFFLLILVSLIKLGIKKNLILTAALLGLLGHSIFVNSLFYPFVLIWIVLTASNLYEKPT